MLKNYVTIALRHLLKYRSHSAINIAGLAVGMSCCILIGLFVSDEFSFDRYHEQADRIYRVQTDVDVAGNVLNLATTSFPMAGALKHDYAEVQAAARLVKWGEPIIGLDEKRFKEKAVLWADPEVFQIFSWPFLAGDPKSALNGMYSAVLTESAARKYFGDINPIGRTLRYENRHDLAVTGVIKDVPANSHLQFQVLISAATLTDVFGRETMDLWHAFYPTQTFVLLQSPSNAGELGSKLPLFVSKYLQDDVAKTLGRSYQMSLKPLLDIHLSPQLKGDFGTVGSLVYVYYFSAIAVCVLLIACINFVNLTTARSSRRTREIGLRKVMGALRPHVMRQFIGEAVLLSVVAFLLALLLTEVSLPFFNELAGKNLTLKYVTGRFVAAALLSIMFLVGVGAGLYPALVLSKVGPVEALKNRLSLGDRRAWLRKILVSTQFAVSVILMICTMTVFRQLEFIQNHQLGLDKDQVMTMPLSSPDLQKKYDVLRESLLQSPYIRNVAASTFVPGMKIMGTPYRKIPSNEKDMWEITTIPADPNFVPTMGIGMLAGRNYSNDIPTDMQEGILVNEAAAQELGWSNPSDAVGRHIEWLGMQTPLRTTILGVMRNFNYGSLHQKIGPLIVVPVSYWPDGYNYVSLRVPAGDSREAIHHAQTAWQQLFPSTPFSYSFLDQEFGKLYASEEKMGRLFTVFALLAVFIACLGLLGLSAFMAEVRTKEIGVRKVLGASSLTIVRLMSLEFIKLVTVANVAAWPLAYLIMTRWLETFAYRTSMSLSIFVLSGSVALLIALATIAYQALKASGMNPAKVLKYE